MSEEAVRKEEWQVQSEKVEESSPAFAGQIGIADHLEAQITNFYFLSRSSDRSVFRVQFNKSTNTWGKITPVEIESLNEGESTNLSCRRFDNGEEDICAMSTNGAVIYKAFIPSAEPSEPIIRVRAFRKLRISGENIAARIQLGGDYVLVSTRPMKLESAPKIMIWDAPDPTVDPRPIVPVSQIFDMGEGDFADPRSTLFLGSQYYEVEDLESDSQAAKKKAFEIFFQQQIQGADKNYYTIMVRRKTFKPWTLYVGEAASAEGFNKAIVTI